MTEVKYYKNLRFRFLGFLVFFSFIGLSGVKYLDANQNNDTSLVALINGEKIIYEDIKADPRVVKLGHPKELDPSRLDVAIHKYEMRRFLSKINRIIQNQKIKELGFTVSRKEVDKEIERKFKLGKIDDKKAMEMIKQMQKLVDALEEWQKNSSKSDEIYKARLASIYSKRQWEQFQMFYDSPQKVSDMKSLIPKSLGDMKENSRKSSKNDVLYQKFQNYIISKVFVSDKEVEMYYQKKYGQLKEKPKIESVRVTLHKKLLSKKKKEAEKAWWQEQYKKAKIEIKDERFKSILELLIPPEEESKMKDSNALRKKKNINEQQK